LCGRVAGLEIVGFLDFDRWQNLPKTGLLWHVSPWQPLPLDDLLKSVQSELRARVEAPALAKR
jgi:hypothetical protein